MKVLCVAVNVASGMKYLHEKQVIHGGRAAAARAERAVLCGDTSMA